MAGWRTAYAGLLEQAVLDALDPVAEAALRRQRWAAGPVAVVAELQEVDEAPEVGGTAEVSELRVAATIGSRVAGFAMGGAYSADDGKAGWATVPGAGELRALYVDPAAQGRGVGRALLARVLAELSAVGHPVCQLWVLAGNSRARGFYAAGGFTDQSPLGVAKPYIPRRGTRSALVVRYSRRLTALDQSHRPGGLVSPQLSRWPAPSRPTPAATPFPDERGASRTAGR